MRRQLPLPVLLLTVGHAFTHPDSWYDEYRRILELFNAELKP